MHDHPPDRTEKAIRFGCGFTACGLLLFLTGLTSWLNQRSGWGPVLIGASLGGWLAMRYGDRFWEYLKELLRWW